MLRTDILVGRLLAQFRRVLHVTESDAD